MQWKCGSYSFDTKMPIIMGILNLTPDSFSDGGLYNETQVALAHAREMIEQGAHMVDVGGESTRPGSAPVTEEEELARVIDVVRTLSEQGICVSIDTRHASVAQACVEAGASIINDISGFRDPAMIQVAANCDAGLVVMHMKGDEPATMQQCAVYDDVVAEVRDYLRDQARMLEEAGVDHDRICVDPGPGFGKTAQQTLDLVRNFQEFVHLGYPVMAAVSRKSYIGAKYQIEEASQRDIASAAEALLACEQGAHVFRVHNVGVHVEALKDLRPYALIALGCNVALVAEPGEEREAKIAQLNMAIGDLCALPDTQIIDVSSFYESEPAYYEDQDVFVNAVVLLRTGIPPKELLDYLHVIENKLGRVRTIANGPRTCDLDILDYQIYVCDTDVLTLPHPRIAERDFVVKPLLEILPGHILADGSAVDTVPEEQRIGRSFKL